MNFDKVNSQFKRSTSESLMSSYSKDPLARYICVVAHVHTRALSIRVLTLDRKDGILYWVDKPNSCVYNNLWTQKIQGIDNLVSHKVVLGYQPYTETGNDNHLWNMIAKYK